MICSAVRLPISGRSTRKRASLAWIAAAGVKPLALVAIDALEPRDDVGVLLDTHRRAGDLAVQGKAKASAKVGQIFWLDWTCTGTAFFGRTQSYICATSPRRGWPEQCTR